MTTGAPVIDAPVSKRVDVPSVMLLLLTMAPFVWSSFCSAMVPALAMMLPWLSRVSTPKILLPEPPCVFSMVPLLNHWLPVVAEGSFGPSNTSPSPSRRSTPSVESSASSSRVRLAPSPIISRTPRTSRRARSSSSSEPVSEPSAAVSSFRVASPAIVPVVKNTESLLIERVPVPRSNPPLNTRSVVISRSPPSRASSPPKRSSLSV